MSAQNASRRKSPSTRLIYQLKITLRGSKPPIWRRVLVPAECNLETLHAAIQAAMGWYNSHLHAFEIDGQEFTGRDPMGGMLDSDGLDASNYRLCEAVHREKAKFTYQYDFGDSWDHVLTVEKVLPPPPADAQRPAFACLAGARACPPEDCGGIWGYAHLLEVLRNPRHEEHEAMIEWAGHIDPEAFDLAAINRRMGGIRFR